MAPQLLNKKRSKIRRKGVILMGIISLHIAALIQKKTAYKKAQIKPQKQHDSILTGQAWLHELENGNPHRMWNNLGMKKHVFKRLVAMLESKGGIGYTRHMTPGEQTAIFLYFAVTNCSNRKVAERFQRSGDTISKYEIFYLSSTLTFNFPDVFTVFSML
jgi:hypothetical protein